MQPERILVLSLAIERALIEEDWTSVLPLFSERDALIQQLAEQPTLTPEQIECLKRSAVVNERCQEMLKSWQGNVVEELSKIRRASNTVKRYQTGSPHSY